MELAAFDDLVNYTPGLEGVGRTDRGLLVRNSAGTLTELEYAAIIEHPWELLKDILQGKREPDTLRHLSRVVGYYSRTENWNKSKMGELKDRQAGSYVAPE